MQKRHTLQFMTELLRLNIASCTGALVGSPKMTSSQVCLNNTPRFSVFDSRGKPQKVESKSKVDHPRAKQPPSSLGSSAYTYRAYMADTYKHRDEAKVLGMVEADEAQGPASSAALILDRTIFHPQGGGQPSDQGTITWGSSTFNVDMVRDMGGVIHHFGAISGSSSRPEAGQPVSLAIDGAKRLRHAALHSAGHAVDKAVVGAVGAGVFSPLKGYHFDDSPYVEYRGALPDGLDKASFVEKLNIELEKLVMADIATVVTVKTDPDQGHDGGATSPSPGEGRTGGSTGGEGGGGEGGGGGAARKTRIVTVAGLSCPCGGTHVRSTRELEGVRVTKVKAKKDTLRVSYTLVSPRVGRD